MNNLFLTSALLVIGFFLNPVFSMAASCPKWKKVDFRAKSKEQKKADLSDLVAMLPKDKKGNPVLINTGDGALALDMNQKPDAITGLGECSGWVMDCHDPKSGRSIDDCVSSVPVCKTTTPWTESEACCPKTCIDKYKADRCSGKDETNSWMSVHSRPYCYPGMK